MDANINQQSQQQPLTQPVSQPPVPLQTKSSNKILIILLGIVIVGALVAGAYYLGTKQNTSSGQPTPTTAVIPQAINNASADLKTYHLKKGGYTIILPVNGWDIRVYSKNASISDIPENQDTIEAIPPNETPIPANYFGIGPLEYRDSNGTVKTISSLSEIVSGPEGFPADWFVSRTSTMTIIDGHAVLLKKAVRKSTQPADFNGVEGWPNITQKEWYIDLGNGKFLEAYGTWDNSNPSFENTVDGFVASLKFDK